MVPKSLKKYLDNHHVNYRVIHHPVSYTAQQVAASAHISGKEMAKTVIVKINGKLSMVVEPAHVKINLAVLKDYLKAESVEVAREYEFKDKFPECELGAMPPFA